MNSKQREMIGLGALIILVVPIFIPSLSFLFWGVSVLLLQIALGREFLERWMYPVLGGLLLLGVFLMIRGLILGQMGFTLLGSVGAPWQSVLGVWLGGVWFLQVLKFGQTLALHKRLWILRGLFGVIVGWLVASAFGLKIVAGLAFGHQLNGFLVLALLLVVMNVFERSSFWKAWTLIILPLLWIFGDLQMAIMFTVLGLILMFKDRESRFIHGGLAGGAMVLTVALSGPWRELIVLPRYAALVRPTWSSMLDIWSGLRVSEWLWGTGTNSFGEIFFRLTPAEILSSPFWSVQFSSGMSVLTTALVQWGVIGMGIGLMVGVLIYVGAKIKPLAAGLFLIMCLWWPVSTFSLMVMLLVMALSDRRLGERSLVVKDKNQQQLWLLGGGVIALGAVALGLSVVYAGYLSQLSAELVRSDSDKSLRLLDRALLLGGRDANLASQMSSQLLTVAYSELQAPEPRVERISALAEAAVHYAVRATELEPRSPRGWIQRSNVYLQLLSVAKGADVFAAASAAEAVRLAPRHPLALMTMGRAKAAVASQLQSLRVDGQENVELENQRQMAIVEARAAYESALAGRPQLVGARLGLSTVEVVAGDQAAALRVIEEGLALMPRDVQMLTQAGLLYSLQGKFDQADVVLNEALTLAPTAANARWYLSFVEEAQGEREKALETLKILADFVPENEMVMARIEKLGKPLPVPEVVAPPALTPAPLVDDSVTN